MIEHKNNILNEKPKYKLIKLSGRLVSCMLGCIVLISPIIVNAQEVENIKEPLAQVGSKALTNDVHYTLKGQGKGPLDYGRTDYRYTADEGIIHLNVSKWAIASAGWGNTEKIHTTEGIF